ncbi:MAG: hypothetical protein WC700_04595 [Gemmatimonadaceae bacterium]
MRKPRTLKQALVRQRIPAREGANSHVRSFFTGGIPRRDPRRVYLNTEQARLMRETAVRMVIKARKPPYWPGRSTHLSAPRSACAM